MGTNLASDAIQLKRFPNNSGEVLAAMRSVKLAELDESFLYTQIKDKQMTCKIRSYIPRSKSSFT
jgi:hypothetical protein